MVGVELHMVRAGHFRFGSIFVWKEGIRMQKRLSLIWDLDSIFPGGVRGSLFQRSLEEIRKRTEELDAAVGDRGMLVASATGDAGRPGGPDVANSAAGSLGEDDLKQLADFVLRAQGIAQKLAECSAFTSCATAQDVADQDAQSARADVRHLGARLKQVWTRLDKAFLAMDQSLWEAFLALPEISEIAFALNERREIARRSMPPEKEALASQLAVDGYHAWSEMYHRIAGKIRVAVERDGMTRQLSVAQAQNEMSHHPDRDVRQHVFERYEEAWQEHADLLAACLNHIGGFRLALYRNRGWEDILAEPLADNRIRRETLDAMWHAVGKGAGTVVAYLKRKALVIGADEPAYFDVDAPVGSSGGALSFDEAAELIIETFRSVSPAMAALAQRAFEKRWIEAEDRPGKRAGGFCSSFPLTKESRIFLTYDNSTGAAATLAHELGHAFHHAMVNQLPYLSTAYPMTLAETASTLAEKVVTEASKRAASDINQRLALVDDAARRAVAFFMNIRARFQFELAFYQERRQGAVPASRLSELMLDAQKEAYHGALSVYHPLLWASKLHFYLTSRPFYNFPYTFGYLFSHGVLEWAQAQGSGFEESYKRLLRDSGRMQVEELAQHYMGVDLTRPDFWQRAVTLTLADVVEFLEMTNDKA